MPTGDKTRIPDVVILGSSLRCPFLCAERATEFGPKGGSVNGSQWQGGISPRGRLSTQIIRLVNDQNQGWVLDMGPPGPDAGKGGKHLVLLPGCQATKKRMIP
jgi:hypothetical protein